MQRIQNLNISSGMVYINHVTDIYYLTGKKVSKGTLLIFPDKAVFFVDGRYIDSCKDLKGLSIQLDEQGSIDAFLKNISPKLIYVDGKTLTYNQYKHLEELLPDAKMESFHGMERLRSIKDPSEIEKMQKSGHLNYTGYEYAVSILREGITEKEVAWEYEKFCKEKGAECLSFDPIVAFGENSAHPHYHSGNKKLEKGMAVLIDCGVTLDSYTSDMTRCLFFEQDASIDDYKLWKHHFDLVKLSYDRAFGKVKVGEMFSSLDDEVQVIAKENNVFENIKHSLGHGLGLDVHEWPRISYLMKNIAIKEGMFFTIEPGLYFPGKWGIRYENTILMTKSKPVIISS